MYLSLHDGKWKSDKHRQQWRSTLKQYAFPVVGDVPVSLIDESHLLRILQPMWNEKREIASRLRGRIENVLGFATVSKYRSGDNPARWRGHLQTLLGGTRKAATEHHAAMAFADLPGFMGELRLQEGSRPGRSNIRS
jgi:hypothetical protein